MEYIYYGAINCDTTGWTVEYGVGKTADGSGSTWEWHAAAWGDKNDGNNRWWKSKANEVTFASEGTWYASMRFTSGSCTWYVPGAWAEKAAGTWTTPVAFFTVKTPASFTGGNVSETATMGGGAYTYSRTASGSATIEYSATCTSGGATAGTGTASGTYNINSSSGAFTFTPAASGTYVFTVSASNGAGTPASYTITVAVAPAAPGVTISGQTANSVSGTVTCESGATVTLKRYASSSDAGSDTGGTVVSTTGNGTSRSFTDSGNGMVGCTTYYYRAWQSNNGQNSAGTATPVEGTTSDVAGPTSLGATAAATSGTNASVTVTWTDAAGATSYKVQVAVDNLFSSGTPTTILSEDFDGESAPDGWTFSGTGWYTSGAYRYSGDSVKFDGTGDYVISDTFDAGATELSFWAYGNGGSGSTFAISALVGGSWQAVDTVTIAQGADTYTVDLSGFSAATQLKFEFTKSVNCALDHVVVSGGGGDGSIVAETTSVAQGVGSYTASGLGQGVYYYYRVKAVSSGGCQSDWVTCASPVRAEAAAVAPVLSPSSGSPTATVGDSPTVTVSSYLTAGSDVSYTLQSTPSGLSSSKYTFTAATGNLVFNTAGVAVGPYVFVIRASNTEGHADYTWTVTVSAGTPVITPGTVTGATVGGATVPATVDAKGGALTMEFAYGTTEGSYPQTANVTLTGASVAEDATEASVSAAVSGLNSGTHYYYQWTAKRSGSSVATATGDFWTACPAAPSVSDSGALEKLTLSWTGVDGAANYKVNVCEKASAGTSSRSGRRDATPVLNTGFSDTTGWTLSGTGTYTGAGYYGAASPAIKFDTTGDYAISPDFGSGRTLQFWAYGNSGSGSYFDISGLVNGVWTDIETVYIASGSDTYEVALPSGTSQIRFDFTKDVNVGLDDVVVYSGGCVATDVIVNGTSVEFDSDDGIEVGHTYEWSVMSVPQGTASCGNQDEGETLIRSTPVPVAEVWAGSPAALVESGSSTPVDWGNVEIVANAGGVAKTFTVKNTGDAELAALGAPTFGDTAAATVTSQNGFTVTGMGKSTLAAVTGGTVDSTTFTVTFTPTAAMSAGVTKTATVSFTWDGHVYTFGVRAVVPGATLTATKGSVSGMISTEGVAGTYNSENDNFKLSGSHLTTADISLTLSPANTWQVRVGTGSWGDSATIEQSGGTMNNKTIGIRLKGDAENNPAGTKTGTLRISGGGASADVVVNLGGTVYPAPKVKPTPTGALATEATAKVVVAKNTESVTLDISDYSLTHASFTYSLGDVTAGLTEDVDFVFDGGTGTGEILFDPPGAGVYEFEVTVANPAGASATLTWQVVVGDAPTVTKGTETTSGTTATVPATVNAGGLATTVTFAYGTAEGTYNLTPASLSGGSVAAGATSSAASASLTDLTKEQMYYFRWTAVNEAGTTVVTGSFWQPGDGLEFPGAMNSWSLSSASHDLQFGGGNYYYSPAYQLTAGANPKFKEYKAGTWYTSHETRQVNGNGDGSAFRYVDTTTGGTDNENTLNVGDTGYYTWRGRHTGSGVEYVIMYTESAPVDITAVSDNHAEAGTAGVTVTATLSAAPSLSEKVFVRYKIGSGSFTLRQMDVSGTTATYAIPGAGKGTRVEYYVLTSPHAYVGLDPDLCTLRGKRDTEGNFTYTTTLLPPKSCTVTPGYQQATLGWGLNDAGNNVMVVRYAGLEPDISITAPTDGSAYAANTDVLGGRIVYGSYNGTGVTDSYSMSQGTGYTYVFYSVEGSGSSSKYSAGTAVGTTTLALGTPELGVDGTGYATWSADPLRTGEKFVVARCDGSDGFSGTPSGGEPTVGFTPFCGGKVVYVGTDDHFTDDEVVGCNTYYYKAWLKAPGENAWSAGSDVEHATMDAPGTPVVTASDQANNSFKLSWPDVARADGYLLSVWTTSGGTTKKTDTMTVSSMGVTAIAYANGDFTGKTLTSDAEYAGQVITTSAQTYLQMRATNPGGIVSTKSGGTVKKVTITGDRATGTVDIYVKDSAYETGADLYAAGTAGTKVGSITLSTSAQSVTISRSDAKYIGLRANSGTVYMTDIEIEWEKDSTVTTYVGSYGENGGSATSPVTVSGLAQGTRYDYKVWAVGATAACKSATPAEGYTSTTGTQAPGAPTVSGSSSAAGSVSVTVEAGTPAPSGTQYLVYRFTDETTAGSVATPTAAAAAGGVQVGGGAVSAGTFTDGSGVVGCTDYYYVGWARNGEVLSAASAVGHVKTASVGVPQNLDETSVGAHGAVLTWDAPSGGGAGGYSVDVWHVAGGTKTAIFTPSLDEETNAVVEASGQLPEGVGASMTCTEYIDYVEASQTVTITITGLAGQRITGIALHASSDKDSETGVESGAGSFKMKVGSTEIASIASSSFSSENWNGAYSWDWVEIRPAVTATTVGANQNVTLTLTGTEAGIYCDRYTITYEGTSREYDVRGNEGSGGATCTVDGTGATLAGLQEGTAYGWSVAATGGDCTGTAVADADGFTTSEMVGAPTIGALTPGVGSLGGRVTGTAGASLVLKRYENEAAALAATATSAMGGVPVDTVETGVGTGVWDFSNTGLDGCKTYYYRAWQRMTISGVEYTSKGSTVVGAQTVLGTPSVTAVGAGTQILLSWNEVKGAVSYDVEVSSSSEFRPGAATTRVSEDFDSSSPSGWTFGGTTWYGSSGSNNSDMKYGSSGYAVKFDTDGDSATTPAFTAGATSLSFWTKATSSGSSLVIEALESGSWVSVKTLSVGTTGGGETVDLSGHTAATQLRFTIDRDGGNIGLDHVTVTGPGSGGTILFTATVTAEPYSVTVPGLAQNTEYWYRVTAHGSESCEDKTASGSQRTADGPLVKVTPKRYDFGTVNKGAGGKTVTFTVRNDGNRTLHFTGVDVVEEGHAYYAITVPDTEAGRTADLADGGASREYTVKYDPQASGTHAAVLRFRCDALNADAVEGQSYRLVEVPLTGTCHDPATEDPTVYWMEVEDELGVEDTVTDHSMAQEADEPVLRVLAYHFNRIYQELDGSTWAAKWTLLDPEGNVAETAGGVRLENRPFAAVETRAYDGGKSCSLFSAPIPALGDGNAVRGTYGVEVTVWDAGKNHRTTTTYFVPIEEGWLFEDFTRANVVADGTGKLEQGWTAMASGGAVVNEVEIRDESLVMYGRSDAASKAAGRLAVARNMGDVGYATRWIEFTGEGSWGFHFRTEAKTMGWSGDSLAGAFVLGSTEGTWLRSSVGQAGVAVLMENDGVRLAKFTGSLLSDASLTQIGTATWTNSTKGKTLAVRVDYIPGQEELSESESGDGEAHAAVPARMRLYVKEVEGMGGDPTKECTSADKVAEADVPDGLTGDLRFGGMVWNHGTTDAGTGSAGVFDDIYLPHTEGQEEPMRFHVIDEDTEGPVFEGFNVPAAVAAATVQSEGLSVTGLVCDASGIWIDASGASSWDSGAAAPKWELWVNDTKKSEGTLGAANCTPSANGGATNVAVSFSIPSGLTLAETTNCVLKLSAWDHDTDRIDDSTEGTAELRFTLCAETPNAPAWATLEGDGAEMAVLRWARVVKSGTEGNYVVVRGGAEIGAGSPIPQGTNAVAAGKTWPGVGTVVYAGNGEDHLRSGTWQAREFVVAPGSTNYFAVFGMSGSAGTGFYFSSPTLPKAYRWTTAETNETTHEVTVAAHTATNSSGVPVQGSVADGVWPLVTPPYEPGEGIDAFAYRTSVPDPSDDNPQNLALTYGYETRPLTGGGWSTNSGWAGDTDAWKIHDGSLLTFGTGYPTPAANKLYWHDEAGSGSAARLTRQLRSEYSGDFFVAAILNYKLPEDNSPKLGKWVNIALMNGETELVSFGKAGGTDEATAGYATIYATDFGGQTFNTTTEESSTHKNGHYDLNPGHGNDYIVVGQVSRSDKTFRLWAYTGANEIPELFEAAEGTPSDTPTAMKDIRASWSWANGPYDSWNKAVTGIRLQAGSTVSEPIGHVYFDEVRFAGSWEELFLFNKPEVDDYTLGANCGTNADDQVIWKISDGELAHADVAWTNVQFDLYHRTGVESASFTVLDETGRVVLMQAGSDNLAGSTAGSAELTQGRYGMWTSDAAGTAVARDNISLTNEYTVQVWMQSTGGRTNTVTTSTGNVGNGGATDLFFGEFGEGQYHDKYVELYNGMNQSIDLSQYVIARGYSGESSSTNYLKNRWYKWAFVSAETYWMKPRSTIVLINQMSETYRLEKMTGRLAAKGCQYLSMTNDVLDSGGSAPIILLSKEAFEGKDADGKNANSPTNKPWIDACGASDSIASARFIMSRKADATPLPRSNLPVSTDDWEYRDWSKTTDDCSSDYDDFITTAGENQQKMGLGGEMKFTVFDDDTVGPAVNAAGSGVIVKSQGSTPEEHRGVTPGSNVYVQAAWTFTPAAGAGATSDYTEEQWEAILAPWAKGQTTRGSVTWDPALGTRDAMVKNDGGQTGAELNGDTQYATGCLYVKCNRGFSQGQEVWIGFDMEMKSMTNRTVSFGYKGTSTGFENGWVEWSTSGTGGWTQATNWPVLAPRTDKYTDWAGDLDAAGVPVDAGHLWFRIVLRDYGSIAGAFYLDNFRVEGAPDEVVVTDAEVCERGLKFVVEVKDEASGLDAGASGHGSTLATGAQFDSGLGSENLYRDVGGLKNSAGVAMSADGAEPDADGKWGRGAGGTITWTAWDSANNRILPGGLGPELTEQWFQKTSVGEGQLTVTIADADDDRANDEAETVADFGLLSIVDDDDEMPVLELSSMKPRKGTYLARWRITESGSKSPTKVAEGLVVDDLACQAEGGSETAPKTVLYDTEAGTGTKLYALKQTGWMYNSKYWRVRIRTGAEAVVVTNIAFTSRVSSVLAPPTFTVRAYPNGTGDGVEAGAGDLGGGGEWDEGEPGVWYACGTGPVSVELPANATSELRIYGTGVTATNFSAINAVWAVYDLQVFGYVKADGGEGEESDAYTYVTDNQLASGRLPALTGYLYDTGSGLSWTDDTDTRLTNNPHIVMTKGVKTGVTQELAFASAPAAGPSSAGRRDGETTYSTNSLSNGGAADRASGAFTATLPVSASYTSMSLDEEYAGTIRAFDADADREDASGNNVDRTAIEGDFAFSVVDQDVVRPTAPGNVKVNGAEFKTEDGVLKIKKAGEGSTWEPFNRQTASWTNGSEFLVTFTAAEDQVPTAEQWADLNIVTNDLTGEVTTNGWRATNVVGVVKRESIQSEASGIGEYRVALANTEAALAAGTAYGVAATNGALANYGFERYAELAPWSCADADSAINKQQTDSVYPASEGTNAFYIRNYSKYDNAVLSQTITWTNTDASAVVEVEGSVDVFKVGGDARVFVVCEAAATESFAGATSQEVQLTTSTTSTYPIKTWMTRPFSMTLTGSEDASFFRISFRCESATAYLDNVRLSVKKGSVQPSMKYEAKTAAAQGLAAKYLYAVDADNDRRDDRATGWPAQFRTAYDITPPTAVEFNNTTASGSHGSGALTSEDDPTTQFDLVWVTKKDNKVVVGPDNPNAGSVYTSIPQEDRDRAERDNEVLSPWGSYKVYYRTYDPVAIEAAAADANENTADYLYRTLVQDEGTGTAFYKDASLGWKWIHNGDKIEDPSANASGILRYADLDKVLKPGAPASVTTNGMRLYDLEFDQEYLVVIAGEDAAGNEGPVTATSWATNNTIRFALIKGWHESRADAVSKLQGMVEDIGDRLTNTTVQALQWIAAGSHTNEQGVYVGDVSKDYDLLHWDARSFQERPDNPWEKIQTVRTNWFVDDGGPTNRGSIRFYRASYKDRWKKAVTNAESGQVTAQTPLVSEEVYAQTGVRLRAGRNLVALHGVPYTNTFSGVFGGTETFPGGVDSSKSVCIDFYNPAISEKSHADERYWMDTDGTWRAESGTGVDVDHLDTNFFARAFSIWLPDDWYTNSAYVAGVQTNMHGKREELVPYMVWKPIMQVPTNTFCQVITNGTQSAPMFNIVAFRLPVAAGPAQMNLSGVTGETQWGMKRGNAWDADQIYTIDPMTGNVVGNSMCYCDNDGVWRFVAGGGVVPGDFFKPNDVLVIISKNGGEKGEEGDDDGPETWEWTYDPSKFYTLPNRHMQAE